MSRIETKTGSVTLIPSGYTGNTNITVPSNVERSYTDADHTSTEAQWKITKSQTGSVYYTFPAANIRSDATITSITGRIRMRTYSTSQPTSRYAQLYSGTTAKGTRITYQAYTSTNGTINNLSPGNVSNWSPSDFDELRIHLQGASNGNGRYFSVYGADVTVEYSYNVYYYTINASVNAYATISPTSVELEEGSNQTITITPNNTGQAPYTIYDNNIEVSADLVDHGTYFTYTLDNLQEDHNIVVTFKPPVQHTISGSIDSSLSISPSLPYNEWEGDDAIFTITPSAPGVVTVIDNDVETASYTIPLDDLSPVTYTITNVLADHVLDIQYEPLPRHTISASYIAEGLSISPTLPITLYTTQTQVLTITPNAAGQITVLDNGNEAAIYYILPEDVHSVTYTIEEIALDHVLEFKYSELPQHTATATLTGTGTLSDTSITDYAGRSVTFTVSGVPTSNIVIIKNNNKNVSKEAVVSGTTYTYTFTLVQDCTIQFNSKIPSEVAVVATVDQDATVNPASTTVLEGNDYTLVITPDDFTTAPISVSDNYEEVIESVVAKKDSEDLEFTAKSQTHGNINSGTSYLSYCIGRTAENPYSSTNNAYSSGSSVIGYAIYSFDVSDIPSDAVITGVQCRVNGHLENSSVQSNRFCRVQLYSGSIAKGSSKTFPSTSNTTMELDDVGTWTRAEVGNIKLRMEVGYYGGLVCGITLIISYEIDKIKYYYTTTIYEATNISVKYKPDFFIKIDGTWIGLALPAMDTYIDGEYKKVKALYVKVGGAWKSVD